MKNLEAVLKAAGSGKDKVLKVNIYVTNMADVPTMNEAYAAFFDEPRPVSFHGQVYSRFWQSCISRLIDIICDRPEHVSPSRQWRWVRMLRLSV